MSAKSKSLFEWILEAISLLALLFMIIMTMLHYAKLPDKVPTHFNASGTPDKYGSKLTSLLLPVVALLLYVLLSFIMRLRKSFHYPVTLTPENRERQEHNAALMMRFLKAMVMVQFAYIITAGIQTALGVWSGLSDIFMPIFLIGTLGSVGFFIYRSYRLQ